MSFLLTIFRYFVGICVLVLLGAGELSWSPFPDVIWVSMGLTLLLALLPDIAHWAEQFDSEDTLDASADIITKEDIPRHFKFLLQLSIEL